MKKLTGRLVVLGATLLLLMLLSVVTFAEGEDYTVQAAQKAHNYRDISVSLPGLDTYGDAVDTVEVKAEMIYKGEVVRSSTETKKLADIDTATKSFDFKVSDFGEWEVTTTLKKGDTKVNEETQTVGVVADSYNIANLSATTPGLIFSLKTVAGTISTAENGDPIPSFLTVDRKASFNWDNLPDNIYTCPFAKDSNNYNQNIAAVKDYVKSLYGLDANSHFYLYCNDTCPQIEVASIIWAPDGLPEDSYSLRLITDGSASYAFFRTVYDGLDNAEARHTEMVDELKAVKAKLLSGEVTDYNVLYNMKYGGENAHHIGYYAYALLDVEKDAEWWVVRKSKGDTFKIQDDEFASKLVADTRVTNNYINGLLANVEKAGKSAEFKQLYKFDDSAFEATRSRGKKIMMILGTATSAETDLNSYVRLTKVFYGDDYEYYYKGHPGYLPELIPSMKENLDSLNLQILDSSIAAELFVFYDPDICMSGYPSSTFQGVGTEETDCGIYNVSKEAAQTQDGVSDYKDKVDFFATRIGEDADAKVLGLVKNKDHDNFLVELVDTSKYDFGIYDDNDEVLYLCKDGKIVVEKHAFEEKIIISNAKVTGLKTKTYSGKKRIQKPVVTLNGKTLTAGKDYKLTYSNNLNVGKASVTIKGIGDYTGSLKKNFKIRPKNTSISKLNSAKKAITVKWKKRSLKMKKTRISGYQVQVATNKAFTKNKKTVSVTGYKKISKKISGLKGGKKYYVRVRTFKKVNGVKYYSTWSKVKSVKTK